MFDRRCLFFFSFFGGFLRSRSLKFPILLIIRSSVSCIIYTQSNCALILVGPNYQLWQTITVFPICNPGACPRFVANDILTREDIVEVKNVTFDGTNVRRLPRTSNHITVKLSWSLAKRHLYNIIWTQLRCVSFSYEIQLVRNRIYHRLDD